MKNFSKKVMLMMSLVVACIAFTACSSDDDDDFGGGNALTSNTKLWPAYSSSEKLWGYINESGEWAIKPQFTAAYYFSCERAVIQVANKKYYYIDTNGNYINGNATFTDCFSFENNYAVVKDDKGIYGLIDRNCNFVIQPMYYYLGNVASNGLMLCQASSGGKLGYINTNNDKIIDYQFDDAYGFYNGTAVVFMGDLYTGAMGLIDASGKYVVTPKYGTIKAIGNGLYRFTEPINYDAPSASLYGIMNASGSIIVQPKYRMIDGNEEDTSGRIRVENSTYKNGYIDVNDKEVIECKYKSANNFKNGYASVTTETGKSFIIDVNGNIKINLEDGEYMEDCRQGLFLIRKYENSKYTYKYVNLDGKTIYMWIK